MTKKMETLEQLVDYINSKNYNQLVVNEVIEQNGWVDLSGNNDYDVCESDGRIVTLDENSGKAKIKLI